jgi:hypothetical protein
MVLPQSLNYQEKIVASGGRPIVSVLQPQNSTSFLPGEVSEINIPTGNNFVLKSESYLKFKLNLINGATANAWRFGSSGVHAKIQRVRLLHGANLLQDIADYAICSKIMAMMIPDQVKKGKYSMMSGFRQDNVVTLPNLPGTTADGDLEILASAQLSSVKMNTGERPLGMTGLYSNTNTGLTGAYFTISNFYMINLMSLLGALQPKDIPLYDMGSAPLRLEITWQSNINNSMACKVAGSTFSISNLEFVAQMIELSPETIQMIGRGRKIIPFTDISSFSNSYPLTQDTNVDISFQIPCRVASLKSIFITIRDRVGTLNYFPLSSVTQGLLQYTFTIGGKRLPSKTIATYEDSALELLKAFGKPNDMLMLTDINKHSYQQASSILNDDTGTKVSNVLEGSFVIGLDLETFGGESNSIFSGLNTLTDDIYFQGTFYNTSPNLTTRLDAICLYDSNLIIEGNGTSYVSK